MNKDFAEFQSEFKKFQKLFGLNGYKVYFKHEEIDGAFADISVNQGNMIATVRLCRGLPEEDKLHKDIKQSAKHEALHLLLSRLVQNGRYRYTTEDEISEAAEEIIHKLEDLI